MKLPGTVPWTLVFSSLAIANGADSFDFFEEKIRPVLINHCYECHSPEAEKIESDFLLDTRSGIRKGGVSGRDAIIPGDPDGSQLLAAIRYGNENLQMPPDGKLPDAVIRDFEKWIETGAPDPRDGESRLPREVEADSHWSFQPLGQPKPPTVSDTKWPLDPVDQFVLHRLESESMKPAPLADRYTRIRRATLELTGLPPTPEEIEAYVQDSSPEQEAFTEVVDRLLANPGFGERWGRHWLDVARFAESSGYSRNMLYPYAWRYRNWVIDAFNRDLPYHQFIREQVAGDLLPSENAQEKDRQVTATTFLTIGPKTLNENDPLLFELNVADDQIDATCRAFLALTANCSRCHDHKYDPIPTRDYYALAGIFRSSDNLAAVETNVRAEHGNSWAMGGDGQKRLEEIAAATKNADETQAAYIEVVKKRDAIRKPLIDQGIDWKKNPTPELTAAEEVVQAMQDKVRAAKDAIPSPPEMTMGMQEGRVMSEEDWTKEQEENKKAKKPTAPRILDSPLFERGVPNSPGEPVPRGVLTHFNDQLSLREIAPGESGRLQLAEWLTDTHNPLTARVYVNRIWHHLFGTGLVDTVDNFGLLGSKPSHPELLDYLAREFIADGWSTKRLIRRIVLSSTWQQASSIQEENYQADPDNRLLWRFSPQLLEGEAIRDSILFVGGDLDREILQGSQVLDIALLQAKPLQREIGRRDYYTTQVKTDVFYRSVYLPMARGAIFDSLKVFDAPDPNLVVGARKLTTSPSQSLFLMNSEIVLGQTRKAGGRIAEMEGTLPSHIEHAFLTLLGRLPTQEETDTVLSFFQSDSPNADQWAHAVQAIVCSAEFRTIY